MLIIGSQALKIVAPKILDREPSDYDLVMSMEEFKKFIEKRKSEINEIRYTDGLHYTLFLKDHKPIEIEIAVPSLSSGLLVDRFKNKTVGILGEVFAIPDLNTLYELKLSHRYLKNSPHFLKTMNDIHKMRSLSACVENTDWLKQREKETYAYTHPKLNQDKKDFFSGDGLEYVYDHDTIHLSVKHLDQPAYTYFKEPNKEVMCSRRLFEAAPKETQLYSVLEEAYVLALERSQIPYKDKISPKKSFEIALMKVCTSITSGWWREFAWEHYYDAVSMYSDAYVDKFWAGVKSGLIKPHTK
jgi:hypothetical protein